MFLDAWVCYLGFLASGFFVQRRVGTYGYFGTAASMAVYLSLVLSPEFLETTVHRCFPDPNLLKMGGRNTEAGLLFQLTKTGRFILMNIPIYNRLDQYCPH